MTLGRIDAIGFDDKANKPEYATQVKKKNPWEQIGAIMTGIGSLNLPSDFNSAFTVGKQGGTEKAGAFLG